MWVVPIILRGLGGGSPPNFRRCNDRDPVLPLKILEHLEYGDGIGRDVLGLIYRGITAKADIAPFVAVGGVERLVEEREDL